MHAPLYIRLRHSVNGRKDSPPLPKPRPTNSAESFVRPVSRALLAEESDTYARVIARLNPKWRVIAFSDGIQWILQSRKGQRWRDRYFYHSREGLVLGVGEYAGEISADALVILLRLPRFFPEASP